MTTIITRIDEIVVEINNKLDVIQKESVSVGKLLIEAKLDMTENGKKYSDFIEWCGLNFNIGKAQASKLMKVATVFEDDERFNGVAMRVLYSLSCNATPEQMDRAADFAASGTLNSAVLNQLLNPVAVVQKEPEAPAQTPEADEKAQKAIEEAINNVQERAEPQDFDAEEVSQSETSTLDDAEKEGLTSEIQELRKALTAANELIKNLQGEKVQHNTAKEMPMLPQFKNACPYAVLGLGQLEAKKITVVKKAFRELIKCGYGKGHEAFELLTKAKDALLADIEAAK
ncbi:hypothetical protein PODOV006v2_p0012 [Vibrio phage 15E36.1]|uniref:DUF3102 domain-containing protein n=1 Tax=Vibrio phage 15E36.1 TaxID=2859290 RepID=A0AAE7XV70_9CAUD|nr:hypothetical protein PODOV006v2_p0012 [Vibrio phage 15E36.1]